MSKRQPAARVAQAASQRHPNNNGKQPPMKWLKQQAATLKKLVRRGWKLQADYLENAREQGEVLVEVRRRLEGTDLSFTDWVREETDIGVSTAYLWCDVAEWWDDPCLQELLKNSNPLELTLRQVRDAIRNARQAQGGGKPGSGSRATTLGLEADEEALPAIRSPTRARARQRPAAATRTPPRRSTRS